MRLLHVVPLTVILFACEQKEKAPVKTWELSEKKTFRNTLTKEGYLDSAYIISYKYKQGQVADSTEGLIVHEYNDGKLIRQSFFDKEDGKYLPSGSSVFEYEGGKLARSSDLTYGVLTSSNELQYDKKGRIKEERIIKLKDESGIESGALKQVASSSTRQYDSARIVQDYDSIGRSPTARTYDWNGKLLYEQVNLYVGGAPHQSFTITPAGDTIRRIKFEKDKKINKMIVEADSLTVTSFTLGRWTLGSITQNNKTKEYTKVVLSYDEKGFRRETKTYVMK